MNRKRILCLVLSLVCVVTLLAGCGSTKPESAQEDGFNMKSLEGVYTEEIAHRGTIVLTAVDEQTAAITIDWPGSAATRGSWDLTGRYDAERQAIVYNDAIYIEKTFNEQGAESDKVVYTRGSGLFTLDRGKLFWSDETQPERGLNTFVYSMSLDEYRSAQSSSEIPVVTAAPTDGSALPVVSPAPTPTPAPAPSPTAAPGGLPIIKKSPTDETVQEGGTAYFVAKYADAIWAVWHFRSPDGQTDMTYEAAASYFPTLNIVNGMYSTMKLENIPMALNGWRVYCRYTNNNGSTDTASALITVTAAPAPTATPAPAPTVAPTAAPVVNEWRESTDLDTAIQGSGLSFSPPLDVVIPEGLHFKTYRYRSGIIEADYANALGDTVLFVRKANSLFGTDLSGDYNSYSTSWDITLKGLTVHCLGDGITSNTSTYTVGSYGYAICFNIGLEGSGLDPDQINSFVNCIQ